MLKYSKKWNPYNKFIANVGCIFSFFIMKELIANYIGALDKFLLSYNSWIFTLV